MEPESSAKKVAAYAFFSVIAVLVITVLLATGLLQAAFRKQTTFHIAFPESVIGLNVGSPVTFYGVPEGEVVRLLPMESEEARTLVTSGQVIFPGEPGEAGEVRTGSQELYDSWTRPTAARTANRPFVLVTVRVPEASIPLGEYTSASLEIVSIAGTQAIRVESRQGNSRLGDGAIIVARKSAFANIKERVLDETNGLLNLENVENFRILVRHLSEIARRLDDLVARQGTNVDSILDSTARVTETLEEWTSGQDDAKIKVLLERVDLVAVKLGRLADEIAPLLDPKGEQGNIPSLARNIDRAVTSIEAAAGDIRSLVRTTDQMIKDNRRGVQELVEDIDRLTRRLDSVAAQIDQEPTSLLFGRRSEEFDPSPR